MIRQVWYALSFIFFLTSCSHQTRSKIQDLNPLKILNSSRSNQKNSKIICCNGLKLFIVSSPDTPISGAALIVKTGSNSDPKAFPGMAHFLEHCVFLGNQKYPDPSAFPHFLSKHNGTYNAFTSPNTTSYLFSVESSSFNQAIEQFVHLFISPLFRQEDLNREKHAVHQEFAMHPINDSRRIQRIEQLIAPEGYPTQRFSCGNLSTLSNLTTKDMRNWYDKHYSPENMIAIVYTSEPLEEAELTLPALFEKITQSKKYKPQTPFVNSHDDSSLNKIFMSQAVQSVPLLEIYWHLYDSSTPIPYSCFTNLEYLLKYEGSNSLVSILKEKGWITNIQTQYYRTSLNTADFCIVYELTDKGDEEYETVIDYTFAYMNHIKNQRMPLHCLEEISTMNAWNYSYGPKIELFDALRNAIEDFSFEDFSTYPYRSLVFQPYSPLEEETLFAELNPEQARVVLSTTKEVNFIDGIQHVDDVFNMTFYEKPLAYKDSFVFPFSLPNTNPYIPNFSTPPNLPHVQKYEKFPFSPQIIYQADNLSLYQCNDSYYTTPQLASKIRLRTPKISTTNGHSLALADLYCIMITDLLNQTYYPATIAGFSFSFDQGGDGIDFHLSGHTTTYPQLLENIIHFIQQAQPTYDLFAKYKERLIQNYKQRIAHCPILLGLDDLKSCVIKDVYPMTTKLDHLNKITYHDFKYFCDQLFKTTYIEGLILGSLEEKEKNLIIKSLKTLSTQAFHADPYYKERTSSCPSPLLVPYQLPSNAAIVLLQNEKSISAESQAATQMFFKWLSRIVFTELRTKQQLGYVVGAAYQELAQSPCGIIYLRSDSYSSEELAERCLTFIQFLANQLEDFGFSEALFLDLQHAYTQQMKNPTISFEMMPTFLFSYLFEQPSDLKITPNEKIEAAQKLTYPQFKSYCQQLLTEQLGPTITVLVSGTNKNDTDS